MRRAAVLFLSLFLVLAVSLGYATGGGVVLAGEPTEGISVLKDWRLLVVSRQTPLANEPVVLLETVAGIEVDQRIAAHFSALLEAAKVAGHPLIAISGYRSFSRSAELFADKVRELQNSGFSNEVATAEAGRWVAKPGESEHHTGLAVDIVSRSYYSRWGRYLDTPFASDPAYQWLLENAAKYGFILRYPDGKESVTGVHFEPWHYRYVGPAHASALAESGLTLEQYNPQPS